MPDVAVLATLLERKIFIESALEQRLPSVDAEPREVHAAMHYAVMNGGKRIRPVIALATAELGGLDPDQILDAACAIEFVHTASLILDDLPSMDDSDSRRDQPATHRVYGEATATLAALALLAEAYALTAKNAAKLLPAQGVADIISVLSNTIGTAGLIHGQHVDLTTSSTAATLEALEETYRQKAAVLFQAAIAVPALLSNMNPQQCAALESYATDLGVAFQITDDLIDAREESAGDAPKVTFSTFLGEDGAKEKIAALVAGASRALTIFGEDAVQLRVMAEYVSTRTV
ncbi:MAG TPA: polyprenyl synthetase family protein [Candidatus Hydrogenedentes bacterium]|nr:polyprenyl synthetase family protein [Candidatus Hydrogenedentota bacterium]